MSKSNEPTPVIASGLSKSSLPGLSSSTSNNIFTLGNSSSSSTSYGGTTYNPFITPNGNMFEQQMMMRNQYFQDRRQAFEKALKDNFPTKLMIVHCFVLGLASILAIAIQTLQIIYKISLYYVGSGYWVPAINVILIILAFVLYKKKSQGWYQLFIISRMLGGFAAVAGLGVVNIIGISFCSFSSSTSSTSSTKSCDPYLYQIIIMIVLGFVLLFWNIGCIIAFQCIFINHFNKGYRTRQGIF